MADSLYLEFRKLLYLYKQLNNHSEIFHRGTQCNTTKINSCKLFKISKSFEQMNTCTWNYVLVLKLQLKM